MTVYGYIRVSTDKQTTENQRFEINKFLQFKNVEVDKWINETISGTISYKKRKIGKVLHQLKKDDIVICSELSRLGRTTIDILLILNHCIEKGIQVWTVKENYQLGQDIQSQMMAFVFSMVAQIERTLISQRTKEALQRIKAQGKAIGRPKGRKNKKHVWNGKEEQILSLLNQGIGKTKIARMTGIGVGSVYAFIEQTKSQ